MALTERIRYILDLDGSSKFKKGWKESEQTAMRSSRGIVASASRIASSFKAFLGGAAVTALGAFAIKLTKVAEGQRVLELSASRLASGIGQSYQRIEAAITKGMNGAISRMDALKFSNQAILLGLPVTANAMEELSRTALRLGRAMGLGPQASLESLIVGIGRQSKLWLDNLGIIVDTEAAYEKAAKAMGTTTEQLSDSQKKLIFFNATMDAAREKSAQLGEIAPSLSEKWKILTSRAENLAAAIGGKLVPAIDALLESMTRQIGAQEFLTEAEADYIRSGRSDEERAKRFKEVAQGRATGRRVAGVREPEKFTPGGPIGPEGITDEMVQRAATGGGGFELLNTPMTIEAANELGRRVANLKRRQRDLGGFGRERASNVRGLADSLVGGTDFDFLKRSTFDEETGKFGREFDFKAIEERGQKAAKTVRGVFDEVPDSMGDKFTENLMAIEAQMQALGLKGRGIFGGVASARAGFSSLGLGGGNNPTLKALSDVAGKIAGVGQIIGGAIGIASALGIGGPSLSEQMKGKSNAELREMVKQGREGKTTGYFAIRGANAIFAEEELEKRQQQGSQTFGTVTTMTDTTGRNMLAEITSLHALHRKYIPMLETISINTRAIASGGGNGDAVVRRTAAAGIG